MRTCCGFKDGMKIAKADLKRFKCRVKLKQKAELTHMSCEKGEGEKTSTCLSGQTMQTKSLILVDENSLWNTVCAVSWRHWENTGKHHHH